MSFYGYDPANYKQDSSWINSIAGSFASAAAAIPQIKKLNLDRQKVDELYKSGLELGLEDATHAGIDKAKATSMYAKLFTPMKSATPEENTKRFLDNQAKWKAFIDEGFNDNVSRSISKKVEGGFEQGQAIGQPQPVSDEAGQEMFTEQAIGERKFSPPAESRKEVMKAIGEEYPKATAEQVEQSAAYQGLPEEPKQMTEYQKARLEKKSNPFQEWATRQRIAQGWKRLEQTDERMTAQTYDKHRKAIMDADKAKERSLDALKDAIKDIQKAIKDEQNKPFPDPQTIGGFEQEIQKYKDEIFEIKQNSLNTKEMLNELKQTYVNQNKGNVVEFSPKSSVPRAIEKPTQQTGTRLYEKYLN